VDVKQVGRELGVRYVLEGSVRKAGGRVRITAQLIDAATGAHLWAERFDGALADVFELQDLVTASVAGAIRPELERAEVERARRKPTASLDAYDLYLRALPGVEGGSRAAVDEALALLGRAIELDPGFAAAYGLAARCYALRDANDWGADPTHERTEAARVARLAIEFGRDDPLTLSHAGYVLARSGDVEDGVAFCTRAVTLDPHLATALRFSGVLEAYVGDPETAIERLTRAMRLSPRDPALFSLCGALAAAHFFSGRYDEAASWVERAIRERGNFLPMLELATAVHALAGRPEEARRALARLQRFAPGLRISRIGSHQVLKHRPERLARYVEGLRLAGLPE
ncbi:MAG: tetratricopeptide repeat protein, partial [Alphaproteobacteria bacterium]|nr:tetratricopeptide repeat protein [Alphaproteobacteria bacterium]